MALKWLNFPLLIQPRRPEIASNGVKYDQKLSASATGTELPSTGLDPYLLRPDAVGRRRFAAAGPPGSVRRVCGGVRAARQAGCSRSRSCCAAVRYARRWSLWSDAML